MMTLCPLFLASVWAVCDAYECNPSRLVLDPVNGQPSGSRLLASFTSAWQRGDMFNMRGASVYMGFVLVQAVRGAQPRGSVCVCVGCHCVCGFGLAACVVGIWFSDGAPTWLHVASCAVHFRVCVWCVCVRARREEGRCQWFCPHGFFFSILVLVFFSPNL